MPCSCNKSHCPECMGGWTPPPAPEVGSARWKDNMAFSYVVDTYKGLPPRNCIIQLPADWGFMCVRYSSSGWDYFRVEKIDTQQAAPAAQPEQEPIGEVEIIESDEHGEKSAWVALYNDVELGTKLYAAPVAQTNQMLVEALKELHSVVIDQNRAGTDWGDRLGRLMVALGNSEAALAAVGEK